MLLTDRDSDNAWYQHFGSDYQHPLMGGPFVNVLPGSSGTAQELFKHFTSKGNPGVTVFHPMDMKKVKEGTNIQSVTQTPAIHAVVDASLNSMLLNNIPGMFLTEFLQLLEVTPSSDHQEFLLAISPLPGWRQIYKFSAMSTWSFQARIDLQVNLNSVVGMAVTQMLVSQRKLLPNWAPEDQTIRL